MKSKTTWPAYTEEEIEAVVRVMRSGKLNQWTGEEVLLFQSEFAQWLGVRHAVALANGTVALELALRALGIGPGDEVIVTSRTFYASASCVASLGATVVFCDVDRCSGNMSAKTVLPLITSKTRAIVAVHIGGLACEMEQIQAIAKAHHLHLIEDCAQAHGATYNGQRIGTFGDIACWSFCNEKIMTTLGEGGMLSTNSSELFNFVNSYKDHGKNFEKLKEKGPAFGYKYVHDTLGTNLRMTEVQAAVGRVQLKSLEGFVRQRNLNAQLLSTYLEGFGFLREPKHSAKTPKNSINSYYRYYLLLDDDYVKRVRSRDEVGQLVNKMGGTCFAGSCSELYLEGAFHGVSIYPQVRFSNASKYAQDSLAFLVHPNLTEEELVQNAKVLSQVLSMP